MRIKNSITAKIVISTAIVVSVVLLVTAFFTVRYVAQSASSELDDSMAASIKLNATEIESYFKQHANGVETVFRNVGLIDWFENHKVSGEELDTPEFDRVVQIIDREVKTNGDIISIFFGSAFTGEYFAEEGVSVIPGYNVLDRPWWNEVKDSQQWNVSRIIYEARYDEFYVSINFPINNFEREFIGVGGVDLYLTSVKDIVSAIHYKGQGQAFLLDNNGDMVVFPDEQLAIVDVENRETENIKLQKLDQQNGNEGFLQLANQMDDDSYGQSQVIWRGKEYYVQFSSVEVDRLSLDWKLAIMVPMDYVEAPVTESVQSSALIVLIILAVTLIAVYVMTSILLKPLSQVKEALVGIAEGDGDLSKTIPVRNNDEIGQLSEAFNSFVGQIQSIVRHVQDSSIDLKKTTATVSDISEVAASKIKESQQEVASAVNTINMMAETAHEIKEQVSSARQSAAVASETSKQGQSVLSNSMEGISTLNVNFDSAVHTIEDLRSSSQSIGEVMVVIRNIAEQTNLLALNAAIESARAGEHGRGFAVVADEVRQLAKRTQESTESIQSSINDLQSKAVAAESSMRSTREQINQYMEDTQVVHTQLSEITIVVDENSENMQGIVNITQEQDQVSQSIRDMMHEVNDIGEQTRIEASNLMKSCTDLEGQTDKLTDVVKRFKI
ncbi:methyl-accepting chemotaxis protein [Shewanella sp. KX20019]|uniref:methyl-accepting chemotaxis protein n=1 Tax=Shewanella sp. KX20019 TaxID=2803864 RepID=UPI0019252D36|nr:methyl-accepting chemotaxis protein [Shewanella sp. KX20019]QQX78470.1 methyl-accepting chemotaxis protein [Shewanella sp. KX20019]